MGPVGLAKRRPLPPPPPATATSRRRGARQGEPTRDSAMCRLCAVLSDEAVLLADFLLRPRMSLVRQSFSAQERRALPHGALPSMAYQQPFLNADGFGVGWYTPVAGEVDLPCVFTSLKPAWNDPNLRNISLEVRSPLVLAHIRAAGPDLPVSDSCCHPFKAGRLLFAHNGMVGDFARVRRELLAGLTEYAFGVAVEHACIDSAVAFACLLTELGVKDEADACREMSADELCSALQRTINRLVTAVAGRDESLLNFVICDGQRIVACRYATAPSAGGLQDGAEEMQPIGATLYLSAGSRWVASPDDPETYRMRKGADIKCGTAILSSEPLTAVREEWLPIAPNTLVVCGMRRGQTSNIDILMFALDARPMPSLSALLGVESSESTADVVPGRFFGEDGSPVAGENGRKAPAFGALDNDVWMSLTGHTEDVNCVASLFSGRIVAAGSMDGTLRLFDVETGTTIAVRKHSSHSGPILALLPLAGPSELESATSSAANSPRSPLVPSVAAPSFGAADDDGGLPSEGASHLLLSTANNELRIWNVGACASRRPGEAVEVPCLLCFRFLPNQGQLLALAGTLDNLALGFQSTRVFRLKLKEGWRNLMTCKHRSRSTRYFTCNVDYNPAKDLANGAAQKQSSGDAVKGVGSLIALDISGLALPANKGGPSAPKFCHHSLLEPLHRIGNGHIGYVRCLAHDPKTETLVSGGGDGRVIFWGRLGQRAAFPHGGPVLAVAVRRQSGEAFSADSRGRIRVWDCATVERGSRAVLAAPHPTSSAILVLIVMESPCGEGLLMAGDAEGKIRIWNINRSSIVREVESGMSCCAALCLLEADVCTHRSDASRRWLIRIACGGCSSGAVHIGDVSVVETAGGKAVGDQEGVGSDAEGEVRLADDDGHDVGTRGSRSREQAEFRRLLVLLREFVAIPTVSSKPQWAHQMQKGGVWAASQLEKLLGCTVRVSGSCIVARCGWDESKPLVVLYSHYDVVDAGHGWESNPWKLAARDGFLYGRGVADNKGPFLAQIFAVRKLLRRGSALGQPEEESEDFVMRIEVEDGDGDGACGSPGSRAVSKLCPAAAKDCPVNVLFVVDGGEEVSDVDSVRRALREAREDGWMRGGVAGLLVSNSAWIDDDRPCICYGMRGVIDLELCVMGAERPLHSGMHGGLVPEPMFDLMALCSSLVDPTAVPCVPGFGDGVRPPREEDHANLKTAARNFSPSQLCERLGRLEGAPVPTWLQDTQGAAVEALRRTWLSPALSVTEVGRGPLHQCGRHIAHKATCVISARTVPCQTQEEVIASLHRHLRHEFDKRRSPNRLEIKTLASCDWWEARTTSHVYRAARSAVAEAWGIEEREVLAIREGGTMAVLPALEAELGCDAVQLAFSQATSALHLPNERIASKVLARAVDAIALTLVRVGAALAAEAAAASMPPVPALRLRPAVAVAQAPPLLLRRPSPRPASRPASPPPSPLPAR